jgi:hypothetical protein
LECGKILFDREEAARKFLEGQPIKEDEIHPRTISPHITPTFLFSSTFRLLLPISSQISAIFLLTSNCNAC